MEKEDWLRGTWATNHRIAAHPSIFEGLQDHLSFDVREECEAMPFGFAGDLEEETRENNGTQ